MAERPDTTNEMNKVGIGVLLFSRLFQNRVIADQKSVSLGTLYICNKDNY